MTPPVRPEADPSRLDAAVQALKAQGAPDEAIHAYLLSQGLKPVGHTEGVLSRGVKGAFEAASQMVRHPIDSVVGMTKGAVQDLGTIADAVNAGMGQPTALTPEEATHVPGALARTATTLAFPGVAGKVGGAIGRGAIAKAVGLAAAGGLAGAAQNESDPAAGAVSGGLLAPIMGAASHGVGKALSSGVDIVGRPMESGPLIKAGPVRFGQVEGVTDRAARLNAPAVAKSPALPTSNKPLAPVDAGTPVQRLARGLKTSSPAAEATFRGALEPRGDQAVERVIDHAKELTGIKQGDAYTTHENLKATTQQQGDEAYTKAFGADGRGPTVNIKDVLDTPAGKKAWKTAQEMMENDGYQLSNSKPPQGIPADQWELLKAAGKAKGIPIPEEGDASLREAHYLKLALDDIKEPGLNRGAGAGGIGYNQGRSVLGVQKRLLAKMDAASPDYATARSQFADNKALENASTLGQDHWTRDPVESAAMLKDMTPAEQKIYRDQAFDRWATRTENGPDNVAKGQSKSLNQKRLRLLFPDDQTFGQFKTGLQQEAQMHATKQGVLSGSTTADKLADMADMAGVSLPDVFKAIRGNPLPLVAKGAKAVVGQRMSAGAERLAAERARLLVAGADGNPTASAAAMRKMAPGSIMSAITGQRALPPDHDPTLPEVLDPRRGVNREPPSAAAQAIRQQVEAITKPAQRVVSSTSGKTPTLRSTGSAFERRPGIPTKRPPGMTQEQWDAFDPSKPLEP